MTSGQTYSGAYPRAFAGPMLRFVAASTLPNSTASRCIHASRGTAATVPTIPSARPSFRPRTRIAPISSFCARCRLKPSVSLSSKLRWCARTGKAAGSAPTSTPYGRCSHSASSPWCSTCQRRFSGGASASPTRSMRFSGLPCQRPLGSSGGKRCVPNRSARKPARSPAVTARE